MVSHPQAKFRIAFFLLLLIGSACSGDKPPSSEGTITIISVQVYAGPQITYQGYTTLADGACILTQLYVEESPLPWWPSETCAIAGQGEWSISVSLGVGDTPSELDPTTQYILHAWAKDQPSIKSEPFWFDLAGPPTAE